MPVVVHTQQKHAVAGSMQPVNDPLQPYVPSAEKPWDTSRVEHLYRRMGFGASLAQIQAGLAMNPSDLIDQLLDNAANLGLPDPPYWAAFTSDDYAADPDPDLRFVHRAELAQRWLGEMLDEGIRSKMALFWHNHFVTELDVYDCNNYLWDYFELIHDSAFGNFRVLTREMGRNSAMLVYLNGNLNIAAAPNENYARELMELFTMGESNGYTQVDIVEMSRSLTGWQAQMYECKPPYYDASLHDTNNKTIFGQTANYGFTTAHNLIFDRRADQVSMYITGKIYKYFVYQKIDAAVINGLAATFKSNNWEILPVLKQLFKSEHFFDDTLINAKIKSPVESLLNIWKSAGVSSAQITNNDWWNTISYYSGQLGQYLFNPPNVAGWPGQRAWINESTLTARWSYSNVMAYYLSQEQLLREQLRGIAQNLTNNSNDPALITRALVLHFLGQNLDAIHLQAAILNFKAGIPENYYQDGSWTLDWDEAPYQIVNLLYYLVRLPEFQLA
jgi:uncharacterized protein (DUF1800 family)